MSSHYATIVVVGVGGVIGELSNCEGRLALLFETLCLIVAKHASVSIRTERSCFDCLVPHGFSPFFLMLYLTRLQRLVGSRSCVSVVSFGCYNLGLIDPFFLGLVLFLHPS